MPDLKIIATGSSSFDLANKVGEALTEELGLTHFPNFIFRIRSRKNDFELNQMLEDNLIFGSYPEIFSLLSYDLKKNILKIFTIPIYLRIFFELVNIKNSQKIRDLLKLLAFQIGNEVSLNELACSLDISRERVENYIDLLEKAFVVFRLSGFSRTLERRSQKWIKFTFTTLGFGMP